MDPPDSTESNLNLSIDSEIFGHRPNPQYDINDDFFQDLFFISNENKESVVADQLENGDLEYDCNMKSGPENPDSDEALKPPAPIIGQVSAMIENLKQQNKELKERSFKQECELAQYEEKLSEKMSDLLQVQMERDSLKENLRIADTERESLKLKVEEKEAELKQFKGLVQKQVTEEEDIQALKKQMSNDARLLKKTEKELQHNTDLLNKSRENLRALKKRNRKLVETLLEFGDILESKELLSKKRKKYLEIVRSKFKGRQNSFDDDDDSNPSSPSAECENTENTYSCKADNILNTVNMPNINGLIIKKEETSSFSNGLPVDSYSNSEVYTNGFLRAIKTSPHSLLEDESFVGSTKSPKYAPSSLPKESDVTPISHITCKTEEICNDVPNQEVSLCKTSHLSPDSNFQSFASGTESLCSEDLEITDECFAEIKEGIKGWVLKSENYAPLSPLPPSPSPKGNTEVGSSVLQNESERIKNSDKFIPFSSVSTSLEPLSECIKQKNVFSENSSSRLNGESERTESSNQFVPFTPAPCMGQQITPTSPEMSFECMEKKNVLSPQNSQIRESKITESSNQVQIFPDSDLDQQATPISPQSSSECVEKENVLSPLNSSSLERDLERIKDKDKFIPFSGESNQNVSPASPEPSSECIQKKNILSHQTSKEFEPHIEENSESSISLLDNSTSKSYVPPPIIPPELHYLSSSYCENNSFKILHQGGSVYDYLINPETKLSVCVLSVAPKRSSLPDETASSSANKNVSMLPREEDRMKRVLSLYRATERQLTLVKNQILTTGSSLYKSNSANENLPHICVVVDSENELSINTVGNSCAPENANDSGMDLDDTTIEDTQKNNSFVSTGQTDENLPLVSSSCDVSTPSKRKLTSNSFKYHAGSQSKLTGKKRTKSQELPQKLHQNDKAEPGVCETVNRKKRVTDSIGELPCKKTKIVTQLPNVVEENGMIIVPSDDSDVLTTNTSQYSPNKSQCTLEYSPSKKQPLSNILSPQQELKDLSSKYSPVPNVNSPQLELNISPSKSQPSFNVSSPQKEVKNSSSGNDSSSELFSKVSSPQLELEKSSEDEPLSYISSPLQNLGNSPAKNQLKSVSSPELEKSSEDQPLSYISSPQQNLGNSPAKNQLKSVSSPELEKSSEDQPLSYISSPQQNLGNSPAKNQLKSVSSPELEQQNSPSKYHPIINVNTPQVEPKNSPEKGKLLFTTINHLLEDKNSPIKNQPLSNVSNQQLELISPSENQPLSYVNNPELELKDSPSKNQHVSNNNSPKLELKNSPLKHQNLSSISNPLLEAKKFPSKCQPLPNISSPPLELRNSPSKNQPNFGSPHSELKSSPSKNECIDNIGSPDLFFDENSLVIDEDIEEESELPKINCIDNEEMSKADDGEVQCSVDVTNANQTSKKSRKRSNHNKKKKNKASCKAKTKKKKPKLSTEEGSVNLVFSIPNVLELIDSVKIHDSLNESHFKRYAHTLFSVIINPSNASSATSVLYQIFNHLRFSRTNPLMSFPIEYDISVFFPLTERCIVTALNQAEQKKKSHLKGLIAAAINNLYLLVLSKESISKTGLGAFCRVFTELCKNLKNRKKPIMLCCELIKTRHKFAPILIASVMGVWPELFAITDGTPDDEVMLQGSIAYGLEKKPPSLTSADWKQCKAVFSKYLMSPPIADVDEATKNLIEILEEFLEETPREDDYMMTDPLLMFAACNGWNWAQTNLSYFILPSLARYAQQREDERAFSLFCNLYADISLLSPSFESCSEILEQLFILKEAFDYVKGCAARSMIKLYLLSKHKFPSCLYDWTQENESKLIGTPTELLLKQRLMSDVSSFSENDIIAV